MSKIDPRGIMRQVIRTEWTKGITYVHFDCGHTGHFAPHFAPPKPGAERRCFHCGQEAKEREQKP